MTDDTTPEPVRILSLEAQNVMRLRAVRIRPDGKPVIVVGGKNGNGKSSVLRSIEIALGGKKALPPEPIRKGERHAESTVELSNGLRVTRTIDAGGSTKLTVTDKDGKSVKSPQGVLDKMYRTLAVDPLAASRMKPSEQAAVLREIAGVDTEALDEQRQATYDQRTEANREVKRLRARLDAATHHPEAPDDEVSVSKLASELEAAQANNQKTHEAQTAVENAEREVEAADAEVERLAKELASARTRRANAVVAADDARLAAAATTTVDTAPIREQMATAEDTNRKVRDNRARGELVAELDAAAKVSDELTAALDSIDEQRRSMLASAELPIPGLGFSADGVTLDGVPLEQASQAQQLRLWTAVGFRQNPELKVLLVRSGSDLDEDSLALLGQLAAAEGGEVWLERVSTGEECSVVIEDGAVRGAGGLRVVDEPPVGADEPPAETWPAEPPTWDDFA